MSNNVSTKLSTQYTGLLPANFDVSKLEPLGGYSLRIAVTAERGRQEYDRKDAFLFQYGKSIVYLPSMGLRTLKEFNEELFQLVVGWLPYEPSHRDLKEDIALGSVYFNQKRELLPRYEFKRKGQKLYHLFSYRHRLNINKYHIVYTIHEGKDGKIYQGEHLCQRQNFVRFDPKPFNHYQAVAFHRGNEKVLIVDMITHQMVETYKIDTVLKVSKKYIVGASSHYSRQDEQTVYKFIILDKNGETVWNDHQTHLDSYDYRLIADRYLATGSYQQGVYDLQKKVRIPYPFENTCDTFITEVTESTFTDAKGIHPIDELPDLSWTGYDTKAFLKKFHGFIPSKHHVGWTSLFGTGGYERYNRKVLEFRGLDKGIFYPQRSKLINLQTEETFPVDEIMMSWLERNQKVGILPKKPKDVNNFSILSLLKQGKEINRLVLSHGVQLEYKEGRSRRIETKFLREEIIFTYKNLKDVRYVKRGRDNKLEIECTTANNQVVFETDMKCKVLEVVSIK